MRLHPQLAALAIFACLVTSAPVGAQDLPGPGTDGDVLDGGPRVVTCPADEAVPVIIEAPSIEALGPLIRACGGMLFMRGSQRITAAYGEYNVDTFNGLLRDVTFTTCAGATPDYRLEAREVRLLPGNKLHARDVALYLGNTRVLVLPSIKMRIGGRSATTAVFPRPGYDKRDGFTLSQDLRLVDEYNWRANADLTLTTNHGMQGEVYSFYGFGGDLGDLPGRFLSYESLRSDALSFEPVPAAACTPEELRANDASRLRAFGRVTLKQRTYDINNEGLVVYRQPEVGFAYTGNQLSLTRQQLDPRLEIYPEVVTSWGRFRETPGTESYIGRTNFSITAGLNVLPLGPRTSVQPIFSYGFSKYGTGDTYEIGALGLDVAHLWRNGSLASVRYIRRGESGVTPFQFDNVDIRGLLQGEFQFQVKKHILGLALGYNADTGSLYDWEVMYGWRSDCLGTWVRYNQRLKRLVFDVKIINL